VPAPPAADQAARADVAEAEQYIRGVIKNGNLLAGGRRLLPILLAEYDRRGAELDRLPALHDEWTRSVAEVAEPATEGAIRAARYSVTFDDLFRVPEGWLSWRCLLGWTQMAPGYIDGACRWDHNVDSWEQLRAETAEHLARWHPHVAALAPAASVELVRSGEADRDRCPNDPPCPHPAHDHDHSGYISARATCCVYGCGCGAPGKPS